MRRVGLPRRALRASGGGTRSARAAAARVAEVRLSAYSEGACGLSREVGSLEARSALSLPPSSSPPPPPSRQSGGRRACGLSREVGSLEGKPRAENTVRRNSKHPSDPYRPDEGVTEARKDCKVNPRIPPTRTVVAFSDRFTGPGWLVARASVYPGLCIQGPSVEPGLLSRQRWSAEVHEAARLETEQPPRGGGDIPVVPDTVSDAQNGWSGAVGDGVCLSAQ